MTGSSNGIGRAVCVALAEWGVTAFGLVDVDARPRDAGPPTAALLAEHGAAGVDLAVDLAGGPECLEPVADWLRDRDRLEVLVNCAGLYYKRSVADDRHADVERMLRVNTVAPLMLVKLALPALLRSHAAAIVNIGSGVSSRGSAGRGAYAASKGGLLASTYALAAELGPRRVRVNAVLPGFIGTDMVVAAEGALDAAAEVPLGRIGAAREVAEVVAWLASPWSSYVHGAAVAVDGGAPHRMDPAFAASSLPEQRA